MTAALGALPVVALLAYWLGRKVEHRWWVRFLANMAKGTGHTSAADGPADDRPCQFCRHVSSEHAEESGCERCACKEFEP